MRMTRTGALLLILCGQPALAADIDGSPCRLVDPAELATMGFRINRAPATSVMDLHKGDVDAPVDTHSEVCTLLAGYSGDRLGLQVTVDTFAEKVSEAQLHAWTEAIMRGDRARFTESRVGNATCEVGEFELRYERSNEPEGIQHFVSCEMLQIGGVRRVNIYFQVPEDKALLPTTERVKALLDKIAGQQI